MASRKFFRISDLTGGLNPDRNQVLVQDNEATSVQNVRFDKLGSITSRRGMAPYYDADPGADILALGRWAPEDDPTAAEVLIAAADGVLYLVDPGSGAYTSLASGLDTSAEGEFTAVANQVLYANGVDTPVVYDGTDAVGLGIAAPASAPGTSLAAGALTGTFGYRITFYDSGRLAESNPSDAASVSPSSQDVTLTLPTSDPSGRADFVRVYRTEDSGATYQYLAQVALATGTYVDDGTDSLNPLIPLVYDRDTPGAFEHVAYMKGYVFGSIGNTLYWSKALEPDAWPALSFTDVPFEGNDTIRALVAFQDTLVVFGRRNVVLVAGSGGNWSLSRADIETGAVNRRAVAEVEGQLVYLSHGGLRTFPGAQPISPKLDRTFAEMPFSTIEAASLAYVPEERALWIAVDGGVYTHHVPNGAVSWYSFGTPQLLAGGATGFDLPLFIDSGLRRVQEYGGADDDDGTAITMQWRSKLFQLENPETTKFFRRIGAFASRGSGSTVTVTIGDTLSSKIVTLDSTSSEAGGVWDSGEWDSAKWASEGLSYFIAALPADTLFGHTMQVTISADATSETEVVSPITFEYREANRFLGRP